MRRETPCVCGDPRCWRCFPEQNAGPDEAPLTVPDACASLLDALDAAESALARLHAAVQRLLDAVHTSRDAAPQGRRAREPRKI